jgi:cytochrome b6-f complex iron-sulfur subunit
MNRREFVSLVGVSGAISALPVAVTGCRQETATTVESPAAPAAARADGFEVAGTVADLDKTGQLLNERMALGKALVVRVEGDQLLAVEPTCNHQGCSVAWDASQTFICPCHDSKFAKDGKVLEGPATQALPIYTAKIEGDQVLVKKS